METDKMIFCVSLVFKSTIDHQHKDDCLWEESIVLVYALFEDEAIEKAKTIAKTNEIAYENTYGQLCTWSFVGISGCYQTIEGLSDGSEIFSRFLESKEALSLLR